MAIIVNHETTLARQARHDDRCFWLALSFSLVLVGIILYLAVITFGGWAVVRKHGLDTPFVVLAGAIVGTRHTVWWPVIVSFGLLLIAGKLAKAANRCLISIRGHRGELRVVRKLATLPDDFWILNDVQVPHERGVSQTDHLVVSPYGLWAVETKSHLGVIHGDDMCHDWTQEKRSSEGRRHTRRFLSPVRQNATHCRQLSRYLRSHVGCSVDIRPIVVFTAAELRVQSDTPVIKPARLRDTILQQAIPGLHDPATIGAILEALKPLSGIQASEAAPRPQSGLTDPLQPLEIGLLK